MSSTLPWMPAWIAGFILLFVLLWPDDDDNDPPAAFA